MFATVNFSPTSHSYLDLYTWKSTIYFNAICRCQWKPFPIKKQWCHLVEMFSFVFTDFGQKIQFVKSTVHLIEQIQCICLDHCIYNILRNTEETSSTHHMTTICMEPPREEKRKAEKHRQRKKDGLHRERY